MVCLYFTVTGLEELLALSLFVLNNDHISIMILSLDLKDYDFSLKL